MHKNESYFFLKLFRTPNIITVCPITLTRENSRGLFSVHFTKPVRVYPSRSPNTCTGSSGGDHELPMCTSQGQAAVQADTARVELARLQCCPDRLCAVPMAGPRGWKPGWNWGHMVRVLQLTQPTQRPTAPSVSPRQAEV